MPLTIHSPSKRPICPECRRDMVFAVIEAGQLAFQAWICDCRVQPPGIVADIIRAREWDDMALELEVVYVKDEPA